MWQFGEISQLLFKAYWWFFPVVLSWKSCLEGRVTCKLSVTVSFSLIYVPSGMHFSLQWNSHSVLFSGHSILELIVVLSLFSYWIHRCCHLCSQSNFFRLPIFNCPVDSDTWFLLCNSFFFLRLRVECLQCQTIAPDELDCISFNWLYFCVWSPALDSLTLLKIQCNKPEAESYSSAIFITSLAGHMNIPS